MGYGRYRRDRLLLLCIYVVSINNAQESQKSVVQKKVDDAYIEDRPFLERRFSRKDPAASNFVDRYAMN